MSNHNTTDKKKISGFSKLSKRGKIKWLVENFFKDPEAVMKELMSYWHSNESQQKILDGFSENTISNFPMPFGVAPNFVINDKTYCVPMVIEESSVVAAASAAAKFWMDRGGFKAEIIDTKKIGQVHFTWPGRLDEILKQKEAIVKKLHDDCESITANMRRRGGGIVAIDFFQIDNIIEDYFQLRAEFETCDSMGANFINSCLEQFSKSLEAYFSKEYGGEKEAVSIMSILSNYTPDCLVKVSVNCPIQDLGQFEGGMSPQDFARRFKLAVDIAKNDPYRATTHNKGIFNGIDAVVIATGNDFRAIEACGHAFAARDGQYRSLSSCSLDNDNFHFEMSFPIAVGTVGGLTSLHPMAKTSLELLGKPNARELMQIITATGLAQNFAAIRSLVTTGIQKGHMKMHLQNILIHFKATDEQTEAAMQHFKDHTVSFNAVREFLES